MALTDKNIVITPNIGSASDPQIVFSGANSSTTAQNITLRAYPTSNGTLSFEGSAGQLFSITNDLANSIFSVNDVSGIPSIEVFANGQVNIATLGGNVAIGNTSDASVTTINGQTIINDTWSATTGAGEIYLNSTTGNRIEWNQQGVAAPATTTRSAGTKLTLYPEVSATAVDYALGIESNHLWISASTTNGGIKLYANTTNLFTANTSGVFMGGVAGNKVWHGGNFHTASGTAPTSPLIGQEWYDTTNDILYKYLYNGTVYAWVQITGPSGVVGLYDVNGTRVA